MKKSIVISIVLLAFVRYNAVAQYPANDLYQYNYTSMSPTFTGLEGTAVTFIGNKFHPKQSSGQDSGFIGIETTIDKINSGIGFTAMAEQTFITTSTFLNLNYNYQWKIGEDRKMVAGTRLGTYEIAIDYSVFSGGGDPLLNPGRGSLTNMMAGFRILYSGKKLFGGISADNVLRKGLHSDPGFRAFSPDILFHYFIGTNIDFGENFSTTHSVYAYSIDNDRRVDLNNSVLIRKWIIAGLSIEFNGDPVPKANVGVSIKDKAKILVMVYSSARDVEKEFSGQLLLQFRFQDMGNW